MPVRPEAPPPPRGAADLAALWAAVPVAMALWPMHELPRGLALGIASDTLRGRAWREQCAAAGASTGAPVCADAGQGCRAAAAGRRCLADALFPVRVGGGVPAWRMATVFLRWLPDTGQLRLVLLGAAALPALDWALRHLELAHGLPPPAGMRVLPLGELFLPAQPHWQMTLVTPWVAAKTAAAGRGAAARAPRPADADALHHELCAAMLSRAHKLIALACADAEAQRLGGHLAHHVGEALLPRAVRVADADLSTVELPAESRGNRQAYDCQSWVGRARLEVDAPALPWLSLLAICGGGANADKGFGAVEFTAQPPTPLRGSA